MLVLGFKCGCPGPVTTAEANPPTDAGGAGCSVLARQHDSVGGELALDAVDGEVGALNFFGVDEIAVAVIAHRHQCRYC